MTTPNFLRQTTSDTNRAKRQRVITALSVPTLAEKSNRELGRLLSVDEAMIRKWRAKLAQAQKRRRKKQAV